MIQVTQYFGCDSCLQIIKLQGDQELINKLILHHVRWLKGWPCVTCNCKGPMTRVDGETLEQLKQESTQRLLSVITLNPEEFFRALCGLGLPDELGCEPEIVKSLLLSNKIVDVGIFPLGTKRTVLTQMYLDNGLCIHLASSPAGPVVFKVTRGQHGTSTSAELSENTPDNNVPGGPAQV